MCSSSESGGRHRGRADAPVPCTQSMPARTGTSQLPEPPERPHAPVLHWPSLLRAPACRAGACRGRPAVQQDLTVCRRGTGDRGARGVAQRRAGGGRGGRRARRGGRGGGRRLPRGRLGGGAGGPAPVPARVAAGAGRAAAAGARMLAPRAPAGAADRARAARMPAARRERPRLLPACSGRGVARAAAVEPAAPRQPTAQQASRPASA